MKKKIHVYSLLISIFLYSFNALSEEGDFLNILPNNGLENNEPQMKIKTTKEVAPMRENAQKETSNFSLSKTVTKIFETDLPNFHRKNEPLRPEEKMLDMSCEELDNAITYLIPSTYQYMPDFYDDPYNSSAMVATVAFDQVARYYLPYSWFLKLQENNTQHKAFYRIEKLRRAKAIKNCYVQ